MIHWIFIALFIVAFWHVLKLEKELRELKCKVDDLDTRCNNLRSEINIIYRAATKQPKTIK